MTRSKTSIRESLIARLPPGFALSRRGGVLDAIYNAFAAAFSQAEQDAAALASEINPRMANRLLPDFERVLGPDPCGRDAGDKTLDQRQRLAYQRWTATGGQSIAYFIGMAKALGFNIQIQEFWPSVANSARCGQRLCPRGEAFVWRVRLRLVNAWVFRCGRNVAGERLGGFDRSDAECILRRLKPAHTTVVFSYTESENGSR